MTSLAMAQPGQDATLPSPGARAEKPVENPTRPSARPSVHAVTPDIYVTEKIGAELNVNAVVVDERGRSKPFSAFFATPTPKVLVPVYYGCPLLCTVTLNRFIIAIAELSYVVGRDYEVIALSIDPREGPELAQEKKTAYLREVKSPNDGQGWHFLTAAGPVIRSLMEKIGFGYRYDPASMEYLHRATLVFLDGNGRVVRYLHGSDSSASSIRLALIEAGQGAVGTVAERLAAHFFRYDVDRRRYGPNLTFVIVALGLVLLALGSLTWLGVRWVMGRREGGVV
ncbi:MAG: SCO family protein [Myxococcota bacterium]|nr:SCO family protein [Myxococcota bacterium]